MVRFIDDHRDAYGVEPICAVLPIAPSTYFRHKLSSADPTRRRRGRSATTSCARDSRVWTRASSGVRAAEGVEATAAATASRARAAASAG